MANLEIAQIQNAALKAAALEVDEFGKKDGYIDSSEINLFTDKAIALLNEKKCTAQEFATLFAINEVDKTNTTDVFAKVDSRHNTKNTPEALTKDAEETKRANNQEKIKEIKTKIEENNKLLKKYENHLSQEEISWFQARATKPNFLVDNAGSMALVGLLSATVGAITGCLLVGALGFAAMIVGSVTLIGTSLFGEYKNSNSSSEEQEQWRSEIKEAYLKVSLENAQLKAQLAELQK